MTPPALLPENRPSRSCAKNYEVQGVLTYFDERERA